MYFAPDVTGDTFTFIVQDAKLQSICCVRLNSSPRTILPIKLFVQRAQTGREKFISNINDHLGVKPTFYIVTIAIKK